MPLASKFEVRNIKIRRKDRKQRSHYILIINSSRILRNEKTPGSKIGCLTQIEIRYRIKGVGGKYIEK